MNNNLLSILNELSAVADNEAKLNERVAASGAVTDDQEMVVMCKSCNEMFLNTDLVDGVKCPLCGAEEFIPVGEVAPEGTENNEDARPVQGEVTITAEACKRKKMKESDCEDDEEEDTVDDEEDKEEMNEAFEQFKKMKVGAKVKILAGKYKGKVGVVKDYVLRGEDEDDEDFSQIDVEVDGTVRFLDQDHVKLVEACKKAKNECEDMEDEEDDELVEATKKVVRNGQVVTVKIKKKKVKLSAKQKSALKKARKKSHTAGAAKARNKSMKIRRKKLGEGVLNEAGVQDVWYAVQYSRKALAPGTSYRDSASKTLAAMKPVLADAGLKVTDDQVRAMDYDSVCIAFENQALALAFAKKLAKVVAKDAEYEDDFDNGIVVAGPYNDFEEGARFTTQVVAVASKKMVESVAMNEKMFTKADLKKMFADFEASLVKVVGDFYADEMHKAVQGAYRVAIKAYNTLADAAKKNESVNVPSELTLNEALGLAIVSDAANELESIATELGFEESENGYVKEVQGKLLVLDASEGDVEGVVIFAIDETGETLPEEELAALLQEAGIEFESVEDDEEVTEE